jgi:hypothetical protein
MFCLFLLLVCGFIFIRIRMLVVSHMTLGFSVVFLSHVLSVYCGIF